MTRHWRQRPIRFRDILSKGDRGKMRRIRKSLSVAERPLVLTHGLGHAMQNRFIPIEKIDEEKRLVFGKATKATLDNQDEIVEYEATREAAPEFMKWGNLREMHKPDSAAGRVVDLKLNDEDQEVNVVAKVVDNDAWNKVKEQVYKGFSIGGRALKRVKEFVPEAGKAISKVKKYVWTELSLVDRPAHPECVFTLVKRDDTHFCDPLAQDLHLMSKKVDALRPRILTDGETRQLPDRDFALVRKRKRGKRIIAERFYPIPDKPHAIALLKILSKMPGFTAKEKFIMHGRATRIAKSSHDVDACPFCLTLEQVQKGGEKVTKAERRALQLLRQSGAMDEEFEGPIPAGDEVISEQQRPAKQKKDFAGPPASTQLEGSEYTDVDEEEEGGPYYYDDEEYYPDEDYEDGVPVEHGEGSERLGYDDDFTGDEEERTHIWDEQGPYKQKSTPIDAEDREIYDEEDFEGEAVCPYCNQTIQNALASGDIAKGGMECPGCGTVWRIRPQMVMNIESQVPPVVQKALRAAGRDVSTLDNELAKRDAMIEELCDIIEGTSGRPTPKPRKIAKSHSGEELIDEEDLQKVEAKANLDKALQIKKQADAEGRALTASEQQFCDDAVNGSIKSKMK